MCDPMENTMTPRINQCNGYKKILHLSLYKDAFVVMETGEKKEEYRIPGKWIESRLFNKDGTKKEYDLIKFVNGYGKDKPNFTCIFLGFTECKKTFQKKYSNGLNVTVQKGDFMIKLGSIIKKENIKK